MEDNGFIGVLLVNTGTPDAPEPRAVRRYLSRFLMDKRIRPMNPVLWWFILHLFILPKRSKASAEKYKQIWSDEGSFFMASHEKLAHALEDHLSESGYHVRVSLAMSYSNPRIKKEIKALKKEGCDTLLVLPLYPQSAYCTTSSVHDSVKKALRRLHWKPRMLFIQNYYKDPCYIAAMAALIKHAGFSPESNDRLLFSFHSIPLQDIEEGDTYELQTSSTSLQIASELGLERKRWTIGYQCRFDKGREWLEPYTSDVLSRWAEAGEGKVYMVCPNFAVDCLETLYDVEHTIKPFFRDAARKAGRPLGERNLVYIPCLNHSRAHVKVLASVLRPYLED